MSAPPAASAAKATFSVEYTKSARSACKGCGAAIAKRALRLGAHARDPRGYDSTCWYHVACFPSSSYPLGPIEKVQGFESIKDDDREELRGLEKVPSSKKRRLQKDKTKDPAAPSSLEELSPKEAKADLSLPEAVVAEGIVSVRYAKSARFTCKGCNASILKGALCLSVTAHDPSGRERYHVACFPTSSYLLGPVEKLSGFDSIKDGDRLELQELMKTNKRDQAAVGLPSPRKEKPKVEVAEKDNDHEELRGLGKTNKRDQNALSSLEEPSPKKARAHLSSFEAGVAEKPKTPVSSSAASPMPNSLFIANLSGCVNEENLKDFFKNAGVGPITGVKFNTFADGSSKGSARVQFATAEAVEKACKLNNQVLMGQPVRLNYGHETRMINPDSSSLQKPGHFSENTVLIRGFDPAYVDFLVSFSHFAQCNCADGGITGISIQKDNTSGASEGTAFMEFSHPNCMPIALGLDGTVFRGFTLQVEKAKHVEGADHSSTLPVACATTHPVTLAASEPSTPGTGKSTALSEEEDEEAKHVDGAEHGSTLPLMRPTMAPFTPSRVSASVSPPRYRVPSTGKKTIFSEEE